MQRKLVNIFTIIVMFVGMVAVFSASARPARAASTQPIGNFDGVDANHVWGWACDADNYGAALAIHIYLDGPYGSGKFVGSTTANIYAEQAVGNLCGGYRAHRFDYNWPAQVRDGRSHSVYVYAIDYNNAGNNRLFPNKQVVFPAATTPKGNFDGANTTAAWGWTCDVDDAATALWVDLYLDNPSPAGTFVGRTLANQTRTDVATVCGGYPNHGFSFTLPKALADGGRHKLYAYVHEHNGSSVPLLGGSPRSISFPVTVAAYYFPNWHTGGEWSSLHQAVPKWSSPTPFPVPHRQPKLPDPAWDNDDETQPTQMAQKISAAANNDVSVFLFDWYYNNKGPYLEGSLNNGYLKATNRDSIRFVLMWANHDLASGPGEITQATWNTIKSHIVNDYFTRPSYWKPGMKPYFSIYSIWKFVHSWGDPSNLATWDTAKVKLNELRSAAVAAGLAGVHINVVDYDLKDDPQAATKLARLGADSVTAYTWAHHDHVLYNRINCTTSQNPPYVDYSVHWSEYRDYLDNLVGANYASWSFPKYGKPYMPVASMGWDPSPRLGATPLTCPANHPYPNGAVVVNNTPTAFKSYLSELKSRLDSASPSAPFRFVTIYAWNEWTEGGYLEPETYSPANGRYGYEYLYAVRDTF